MTSAEITSRRDDGSSTPGFESGHVAASSTESTHPLIGSALCVIGVVCLVVWFVWRVVELGGHPVELAFLAAEMLGVMGALVIAAGLFRAGTGRGVHEREVPDSHWFALAVTDIVGRTRVDDLYREIRSAARSAPRWRPRSSADAALSAVLLEGPRRLAIVLAVSIGLLLGVAPFPVPPLWAIAAGGVGYVSLSGAHVALGRGRLRFGDRLRWSYGAIGEVVARSDVDGHAPRRWVGAMAVAVGVSLAVALRGFSDRWTHGLAAMDYDDRVPALVVAVSLVLGALYTIQTTPRPDPVDPRMVVRRLEESSVRQSLLAVAVMIGLVGLFAGVLPGAGVVERVTVVAPTQVTLVDASVPPPVVAPADG